MKDSHNQFSKTTVVLHWVVGLTMIALLGVGLYMEQNEVYSLYPVHKSVGTLIFVIVLARVVWRLMNGWPTEIGSQPKLQRFVARLTHWVLILGTLMMPISGMVMSVAGGRGLTVFGINLIASNPDPANPKSILALNEVLAGNAHQAHGVIGTILIAVVALHVLAALKHHFINKDGTLSRMLGGKI